jgi:N-methylhydantoinase A/oxoprolinase/acetone carboxylase beta subunit
MESDCTELLRRADVPADQIQVALGADMRLLGHATRSASTFAGPAPRAGEEPRLTTAFELTCARPYGRTPPDVSMEVVSWRVRVAAPVPDVRRVLQTGNANAKPASGQSAGSQSANQEPAGGHSLNAE